MYHKHHFLFSDTIANNVSFGNDNLEKEEIIKYLNLAKADYVFDLPDNIYTIIGENGVSLSGRRKTKTFFSKSHCQKNQVF